MSTAFRLIVALSSVLLAVAAAPAWADVPPTLEKQAVLDKPWFVSVSLGGAFGAHAPDGAFGQDSWHQFKLSEEGGYHFGGTTLGPAAGLAFQQAFGSDYKTIEIAPKFSWDFELLQKIGLMVTPSLALGYVAWMPKVGDTSNGMTLQIVLEAKIPFAERFYGFLRPLGLDVMVMSEPSGTNTYLRYDLLGGVGILL